MSRCVPAGAVYSVGAGGVTGLGLAAGGRTAGVGSGTGTSCRAALVSLGASVRLRAVESGAALDCSPLAQARASSTPSVTEGSVLLRAFIRNLRIVCQGRFETRVNPRLGISQ